MIINLKFLVTKQETLLKTTIIFFILSLTSAVLMVLNAPDDYLQGIYARILYIHVPSAWLSLFIYVMMAGFAAGFLVVKNPYYDIAAVSLAAIGATVTLVTLLTGAIWGKPTWGTWWVWDARLTSMLILFFIYMAYFALRGAFDLEQKAAQISSIFTLVCLINIPIIKLSVELWNTLHQKSSVFRLSGPTIHATMLYPLLISFLTLTLFCCLIFILRFNAEFYRRKIDKITYS
jgi:heme exporter protein C